MEEYFVYLLKSEKDNGFYIGQTDNIEKRFAKHNRGEVRSTTGRRPFTLAGFVKLASRKEAMYLERELKLHSDKKLKFIRQFEPDFEWGKTPW